MTVTHARPRLLLPVAVMALALSTAACSGSTSAEDDSGAKSVTIGTVVDTTFEQAVTPKIAKEVGCFADEGLDARSSP